MKKTIILVILSVVFSASMVKPDSEKPFESTAPLKTTLTCETRITTTESSPCFTWTIQNISNKSIYLIRHFAYASVGPLLSIDFRNQTVNSTDVLAFNLDDTVNWGTQKEKILELKPSESFKLMARAKLYPVSGLNQSSPLKAGKYKVSAHYDSRSWNWSNMPKGKDETLEKYGIWEKDVWTGELHTEDIDFTILLASEFKRLIDLEKEIQGDWIAGGNNLLQPPQELQQPIKSISFQANNIVEWEYVKEGKVLKGKGRYGIYSFHDAQKKYRPLPVLTVAPENFTDPLISSNILLQLSDIELDLDSRLPQNLGKLIKAKDGDEKQVLFIRKENINKSQP